MESTSVNLSNDELILINNALNEACDAFEDGEFETLMGGTRAEALALLAKIHVLIRPE